MLSEIIVATSNKGKLAEIKTLFNDMPIVLTSLRDYWDPSSRFLKRVRHFIKMPSVKRPGFFRGRESQALRTIPGLKLIFSKGNRGSEAHALQAKARATGKTLKSF